MEALSTKFPIDFLRTYKLIKALPLANKRKLERNLIDFDTNSYTKNARKKIGFEIGFEIGSKIRFEIGFEIGSEIGARSGNLGSKIRFAKTLSQTLNLTSSSSFNFEVCRF